MTNSHNNKLQMILREALGPGFQFSGPGDALLQATTGPRAVRIADPVQR